LLGGSHRLGILPRIRRLVDESGFIENIGHILPICSEKKAKAAISA
jgi:hypothetical protein